MVTLAGVLAGVLACAHAPVCVYVIGSLPGLTWLTVAPSWQGLAGLLDRWDRVLGLLMVWQRGGAG